MCHRKALQSRERKLDWIDKIREIGSNRIDQIGRDRTYRIRAIGLDLIGGIGLIESDRIEQIGLDRERYLEDAKMSRHGGD